MHATRSGHIKRACRARILGFLLALLGAAGLSAVASFFNTAAPELTWQAKASLPWLMVHPASGRAAAMRHAPASYRQCPRLRWGLPSGQRIRM